MCTGSGGCVWYYSEKDLVGVGKDEFVSTKCSLVYKKSNIFVIYLDIHRYIDTSGPHSEKTLSWVPLEKNACLWKTMSKKPP